MQEVNPVERFKYAAQQVAKLIIAVCKGHGWSARRYVGWTLTEEIFLQVNSLAHAEVKSDVVARSSSEGTLIGAVAELKELNLSETELLGLIAEIKSSMDEYLPTEPRHPLDVKRERRERIASVIGNLLLYTLAGLGIIRIFEWIAAYLMASPSRAIKIVIFLSGLLFLYAVYEIGSWLFRRRGLTSLNIPTKHRERGAADTEFLIIGTLLAVAFIIAFIVYGNRHQAEVDKNARRAQGVVLEKKFAPASAGSSAPIYYPDGNGGVYPLDLGSSTEDRWIAVVRASEGATGIQAIDVSQNLYYRIKPVQTLTLIIRRGGLNDRNKYKVEIDESSVPDFPPDDLTNAKGQIRK